jgi:streptogramin lyase
MFRNLFSSRRSHKKSAHRRPSFRPILETFEERLAPAGFSWCQNVDGNWNDATKWCDASGHHGVPGPGDDAGINFPVHVYVHNGDSANSLFLAVSAHLELLGSLTLGPGQSLLAGTVEGGGGLIVNGGTVNFPNAGTAVYTGPTSINFAQPHSASLTAGPNAFSSTTRVILSGATSTFQVNGPNTVGSIEGDSGTVTGSGTLTAGGNGLSTNFAGGIDVSTFIKVGSGTLGIGGQNGTMFINGGTVGMGGVGFVVGDWGLDHVIVNAPGNLQLPGRHTYIESLAGNGTVQGNGDALWVLYRDTSYSPAMFRGSFTGSGIINYRGGSPSHVTMVGSSSSFSFGTIGLHLSGDIGIDGNYPNAVLDNIGSLALSGTGTIGPVSLLGSGNQLTPGRLPNTPGRFTTGSMTMAGTAFNAILTNGGPGYSQLVVNGSLGIGSSRLTVSDAGFSPPVGTQFTVIQSQGGSLAGYFDNAPNGAYIQSADHHLQFRVNYLSDRVVLTRTQTHLDVTAVPTTVAGGAVNLTVRALEPDGSVDTGYTGTVHFTSSDGQATLPANYTFAAADGGVHTFSVTLRTAGAQSITASDGALTSTATVTVNPAAANHVLVVPSVGTTVAGSPFDVTVIAQDPYNNTATGYTGTIVFSSMDPYGPDLPRNYTFTDTDAGVHTFVSAVTHYTAGTWDVTATDTSSGITGSANVTVNLALSPATLPQVTVGDDYSATISAAGGSGNYSFQLLSGTLPTGLSLSGAGVLSGTPTIAGTSNFTVRATDTSSPSVTGTLGCTLTVNPAPLTVLVSAPSVVMAGNPFTITITARDAYGNPYTGPGTLASSDGQIVSPASFYFTGGTGTPTVTLTVAGSTTLTATAETFSGTSNTITVSPAAAYRLGVVAPSAVTADIGFPVTITALDYFGNPVTNFSGSVSLFCTDGQPLTPTSVTLVSGTATPTVTLYSGGRFKIEAGNPAIGGESDWITVSPAPVVINELPVPTPGSGPDAITAGPYTDPNSLWFREANVNKMGRIDALTGSFTEFPLSARPGSFYSDITAGPDGNVWYTDRVSNIIGRITPSGVVTERVLQLYSGPCGITAGPDGNLWFAEISGKIGRITPDFSLTEFPVPGSTGPRFITTGPDGNLWFTDAPEQFGPPSHVGRISPDGVVTLFSVPTPGSETWGITAGPDGKVWFTELDSNKIGRITPDGVVTEYPIPRPASYPQRIVAGSDGSLWFTEWNVQKIGRITPNGVYSEVPVPTAGAYPWGITAGPDGNIWFTEYSAGKIGRVQLDQPLTATAAPVTSSVGTPFTQVVASFSDTDPNPGPATAYSVVIDWGDGSAPSLGTVTVNSDGSFSVSGSHSYDVAGSYTITLTITDNDTSDDLGGYSLVVYGTALVS